MTSTQNFQLEVKSRYENYLDTTYLMTNNGMQSFLTSLGEVCPVLSYLNPPMGTSVSRQPDSKRIITQNEQLFHLVHQGNSELKVFLPSVPSCNGTSPEVVKTWYILCTKMVATNRLYLHPYFCFRKHADSNNGFTCGFDIGPTAAIKATAEVLYQSHVPVVIAILGVPVNSTTGTTEIIAITGVPEVLKVAHVPTVLAVTAIDLVQHSLHDIFQNRIPS